MLSKIGIKLILIVGLTTIVTIGVYAFITIKSHQEVLIEEVERHGNQLSEALKKSMHYEMLANNRESIHNMINTIGEEPCIQEVRIFNKAGEIIYSAASNDIGTMLNMEEERCYACHSADEPLQRLTIDERTRIFSKHPDSSRVLGIINPIYNEPTCYEAPCHAHFPQQTVLGVLDITLCLKDIDQRVEESEITTLFFSLFSIVTISFIIAFFIRQWVSKPVVSLVTATKNVAAGNLQYKIDITNKDELGQLAESFNNMTKKLAEARMQLFQSDKMASLGRLAAGVAHEINNPLTGVLTYSSFLQKRTQDQPEIQEDLKVIVRETKRSREIVKSLLDFARQSVPKKNKADINQIIEQALSVIENQLSMNKIKLVKDFAADAPKVTVDSNQIQQVFINLIVNASDAIGQSGGTIALSTHLINLSPQGVVQIKKAECSKRHSLLDEETKIEALPSIKLKISQNNNEGFAYLNPVYGKKNHQFTIPLKTSKEFDINCSECGISMVDKENRCPVCGSTIYIIDTPGQGHLKGCLNNECFWQEWREVEASGKKEFMEIKVTDTGCGISEDSLSKIFDPFYSTKGQKGTGLGLAVIWGIIDNHDGTIKVESQEGKGTTFIIRLPVEQLRKQ